MKKRIVSNITCVTAGSSLHKQATLVANKLQEAYDIIQQMGDGAANYIPDHIEEDIDIAIREIRAELRR